jgi:hypothetical protein
MDTMINWYQVRGLGALAAIGLFLVYAVLTGWWQARKSDAGANRAVEPIRRSPMNRPMPSDVDRRAA